MNPDPRATLVLALLALAACGDPPPASSNATEEATRNVEAVGSELSDRAAALAVMTDEEARTGVQELIDQAARGLRAVQDSEQARLLAVEVRRAIDRLKLAKKLGAGVELGELLEAVKGLIERFQTEPPVMRPLVALRMNLQSLTR